MKKKLVVASLAVALIAIAVGGTLAWFMDSDKATNVFTIGSVEIEQIEQQRVVKDGVVTEELEDFKNDKQLIPVISNENAKSDKNFEDKIVTVKNKGKNDAYVQTFVAVPKVLADAGVLHVYKASSDWEDAVELDVEVKESDIVATGSETVDYVIYKYVYKTSLAAGSTTSAAIEGIYIDQAADMDVTYAEDGTTITSAKFVMNNTTVEEFDANGKLNVYVASQAIQADGFADAEAALANFTGHPWATTTN